MIRCRQQKGKYCCLSIEHGNSYEQSTSVSAIQVWVSQPQAHTYSNRMHRENPYFELPSAQAQVDDDPYISPEDLTQAMVNEDPELSLYAVNQDISAYFWSSSC